MRQDTRSLNMDILVSQNPSDDVSQEVKAAEGLFYEEGAFKMIVYCGIAILGVLIITGLLYEYISRKYCQSK